MKKGENKISVIITDTTITIKGVPPGPDSSNPCSEMGFFDDVLFLPMTLMHGGNFKKYCIKGTTRHDDTESLHCRRGGPDTIVATVCPKWKEGFVYHVAYELKKRVVEEYELAG